MKRLSIVRHAKSDWGSANNQDIDRPLNEQGMRDAPLMGTQLNEEEVSADAIIASSALRAYTTAQLLAAKIDYPIDEIVLEDAIYEAELDDLIGLIESLDNSLCNVMLVGHNPGFSTLANYFCGFTYELPTCGIVCCDFKVDNWAEAAPQNCQFVFFERP